MMLVTAASVVVRIVFLLFLSPTTGRLMYQLVKPDDYSAKILSEVVPNRSILMVGDSLMRYQYLSLVHLVHEGNFAELSGRGDMLMQEKFSSWTTFFDSWVTLLTPNELCDCHRENTVNLDEVRENHYYRDASRNISVTYIQYFGDTHLLHGQWIPDPNTGEMLPVKWEHSILTFLDKVDDLVYPKPTTLLLNAGFHVNNYANVTFRDAVMTKAIEHIPQVIWKTCNPLADHLLRNDSCPSDTIMCGYPGTQCLDLSWTTYLSISDYHDEFHLMAPTYDDINIQFLDLLRTHEVKRFTPMQEKNAIVTDQSHDPPLVFVVDDVGRLRHFVPTKGSGDNITVAIDRCVNGPQHMAVIERTVNSLLGNVLGNPVEHLCVGFHDGELVRLSNEKSIFLVQDGEKREFLSWGAFVRMGYDTDQVHVVIAREGNEMYESFRAMPLGTPIT